MDIAEIRQRFTPAIEEIVSLCQLSDAFFDRESFTIYMATIWGNTVAAPQRAGIEETDLETLHDFLNEALRERLGPDACVSGCYEFVMSKAGEDAMTRLHLTPSHKEFLTYFARLILAP